MEDKFGDMLKGKIADLMSGFDSDALNHLAMDEGHKLSRLPDFDELSSLRNKHPDLMYMKAIQLRTDRNELEEKILIPLRRALAALFQYENLVSKGESLIEDDDRPVSEMMDDASSELFAQLFLLAANLVCYDLDPVSASTFNLF